MCKIKSNQKDFLIIQIEPNTSYWFAAYKIEFLVNINQKLSNKIIKLIDAKI